MNNETLRKVLWFDAYASAASVAVTIAGASLLAGWLEVSVWAPLTVGVVLIPWVYLLAQTARRDPLRRAEVWTIVAGNVSWAVGAVVLIAGFPDALSTSGKWIVGIFSLAVLDLGIAEWLGLRSGREAVSDSRAVANV